MVNDGSTESKIAQATRHVAEGRRIVAGQRARVARLKALGHDTSQSESLLVQFETTQAIFEADLRAIQEKDARPAVDLCVREIETTRSSIRRSGGRPA
jgi:2-keto-3-deoxy-L-rhamnonate aldolase RhmA